MELKKIKQQEKFNLSESLILEGDALKALDYLPKDKIECCVTSPPYWSLRDYAIDGQIGLEKTVQQYINSLVAVFRKVKELLRDDGVFWLNIGDSFTSGGRTWRAPDKKNPARSMSIRPDTPEGLKPKDLIGVPWRLAFALQQDGWYLRSDIIWEKPNCMPESVKDRPTRSHEYIFLFSKSEKYYYDYEAIKEQKRNKRTVWSVNTQPFMDAHFATFPPKLIEPCILAGSHREGWVLDPFFGAGTVGVVCNALNRNFIGIELNSEYIDIARKRLEDVNVLPIVRKVVGG